MDFGEKMIDFKDEGLVFSRIWDFLEIFFRRMFDRTVWKRKFLKEIEKFHLDFRENDRFLGRGMSFFRDFGTFMGLFHEEYLTERFGKVRILEKNW